MNTIFFRWLGVSALVFTLGFVGRIAADEPKSQAVPADLAWVPSNCTGFVHIRFAELWDGPLGRNARKILATQEPQAFEQVEKSLGLSLSQIDTVTIVLPEFTNENMHNMVFRVTTTEPYDAQRLLLSLGAKRDDDQPLPAKSSGMYKLRDHGAIHLTGPRTLTFFESEESAIDLLSRMLSKPSDDGISPALRQAAEKHQIIAGLAVNQLPKLPADKVPPELLPLRDTKRIVLVGDFDEEHAKLDVRLAFERNGHAAEAMRALEEGRKLAQEMLTKVAQDLAKESKDNEATVAFLKDVQSALKDAKLRHVDTEVQLVAEVQTASSLSTMLAHAAGMMKVSSNRIKSQNNIKQMSLAMINYADTYGGVMPTAAICDKNGKPLLSWRVSILPYIEQDNLYKQFHLDEPWDSEHNKTLIERMPEIYKLPGDKTKYELPSTHYLAFVGNGAALEEKRGVRFPAEYTDGTSNTIWVAEAEKAVPWTKPEDISYDPKQAPKLAYFFSNRCNVGFMDGSVRAFRKDLKEEILHMFITRAGGEVIPAFDD
jgi:prepilin-type processing-associated H-X9-DG protein